MPDRKPTTDGVEILHRRYIDNDPEMKDLLEQERANAEIARNICDLRKEAGLTQQELADRVGTSRTVIVLLENADYEGHSLSMLRRIAAALNRKVVLEFVPVSQKNKLSKMHSTQ